ncbi:MAG TPA: acyl-CoA dehydrogenase family protein [Spirochaetota bacterium]|nr:acyl-CoA dehydrogenase family protein [Spirochaetota bacterium]HPL15800.1 acyl-CoA dehydrogenase family protein [Spirochaetota bacterium]HQF06528.1 acyl-CoA dehydrogenase family protein [Spirochaetota bacterium]HQH98113.1 acyl-CoA dehydrogenase family protein [Spirochaetota bacterium]HQJ70743.1 acyl-CoA dehydrogenase family protein [Spirochaetota bacterium]
MEKILLNPKNVIATYADEETRQIMLKTIDFFEGRGLKKMKDDFHACRWYTEFLDFMKENQIMAKLLTPKGFGDNARWDTSRIVDFAEILGFYGLTYWYTFQVSALGLGPIFLGSNTEAKHKAAKYLKEGAIFAFGLSEKEHGADIYSSDMMLYPEGDGTYRANGDKYYIGNGNEAAMVSTFGKIADSGEYVFFAVNSKHPKYECVKNIINNQDYVAEYALHDYPITEADILERGQKAWDDMLNTINICKFNLGWASIGICEHAFYESINHASHRQLFGSYVTDFTHIKQLFMDAYCRLVAMKLFALRATDYMRAANENDKRYLLYNPMVKMKVSTQGEEVINLLWDVIAAKGFEKDMYFENAATDIRALPKLEGTVHVNMALIIKFMPNYFFNPGVFPDVPQRRDAANDDFLFNQGPTKGLGKLQFHDYNIAYNSVDLPNVNVFKEQIATFKDFMMASMATMKEQSSDIDFLLNVGELFTLVAYGQLILENKKIYGIDDEIIDQIFDFMVRDMSKFALTIYGKAITSDKQQELCLKMIKRPVVNKERYERVLKNYVYALADTYTMNE